MKFPRVALALLLAASSCGNQHCPPPWSPGRGHELLASIKRTGCFGWCPSYSFVVYRDGVVEYQGTYLVKTVGRGVGHLEARHLAELDELFQTGGYLDLDDSYERYDATDSPTVRTSYSPGGCTKTITHYHGDRSAPKELVDIENRMDRIVGIEHWIGTDAERRALAGY